MRNRRIAAYVIDLLIFMTISFLVLFLFRGVANLFARFILNLLGLLVIYGVVFGLVATYLRGSIGKKIMDLKVMPTVGMMTPIRLLIRDVVMKYSVTLPIVLGMIGFINAEFPTGNALPASGIATFTTGLVGTIILGIGLAGANGYFYVKFKRWMVDVLLDTNVENDIPTATEYQDLRSFIEKNEG
jgi:hypothetical protein